VKISETEASKVSDANCRTLLSASIWNAAICASTRCRSERCVTATPFGRPVEPDV